MDKITLLKNIENRVLYRMLKYVPVTTWNSFMADIQAYVNQTSNVTIPTSELNEALTRLLHEEGAI